MITGRIRYIPPHVTAEEIAHVSDPTHVPTLNVFLASNSIIWTVGIREGCILQTLFGFKGTTQCSTTANIWSKFSGTVIDKSVKCNFIQPTALFRLQRVASRRYNGSNGVY